MEVMMQVDQPGAALIASFEAIYLFTYPDPATGGEPWTAGVGHTKAAGGIAPRPGQIFSMAQVMDMFRDDLSRNVARVNRAVHAPLLQPQFNVCVSFDLNTGAIASGSFDDKLNAGQQEAALSVLGQYTKAAGHFMQGLANRRAIEIAVFRTGQYPGRKIAVHDRPGAAVRYLAPDALPWGPQPAPIIDLTPPDISVIPVVPATKGRENILVDLAQALWRWLT